MCVREREKQESDGVSVKMNEKGEKPAAVEIERGGERVSREINVLPMLNTNVYVFFLLLLSD